ncbi:hypothetical protein L209DRAFT_751134 [Thermothelomyces heterothallicus CBS 203.75]
MGYMYWRLKIKPNRANRSDAETTVGGYWEVTRRDPNRVSITIYRGQRPANGPEASRSDIQPPNARKEGNKPTQGEDNSTNKIPGQLESASAPDIHLVPPPPPPPPPIIWATPSPSSFPPQPQLCCPDVLLQPGLPHDPPPSGHIGVDTAGYSWVPNVPLPPQSYAGCSAPQPVPGQSQLTQHPSMPGAAAPRPVSAPPPPTTSSAPLRDATGIKPMTFPAAEPRSQWRRWFSLGDRSPILGHARTLSDWSSTTGPSRPPSPPAPSISPRKREHGDGNSRRARPRTSHPPARDDQAGYRSQSLRKNTRMNHRRRESLSPSDFSYASSYINTSVEAVFDNQRPFGNGHRNHSGAATSDSESRRHHPRKARGTRVWPSDTTPLSNLLNRRASSRSGPRRRPPSSDIQYPSPERRRPRVFFTLASGSDDVRGSSTSRRSEPSRIRSPSSRLHQSRGTSRGDRGGQRGVHIRHRRKQSAGLTGRVTGAFDQMQRILRGGD